MNQAPKDLGLSGFCFIEIPVGVVCGGLRSVPVIYELWYKPTMAKLIYVSPMSLDGYLGDGEYEWSAPNEEFMAHITELMRSVGTYLYGRKMYETMAVWDSPEFVSSMGPEDQEFAKVWQAANKVVYSKSLSSVATGKSTLEKNFDTNAVHEMKKLESKDISVGGANLAAQAIQAGLVDEYHFFVVPMTLGKGIPVLPQNQSIKLDLIEERRFSDGWLYLRYQNLLLK